MYHNEQGNIPRIWVRSANTSFAWQVDWLAVGHTGLKPAGNEVSIFVMQELAWIGSSKEKINKFQNLNMARVGEETK